MSHQVIWPHVAWRAATLMRHRYCQEAAYESHELAAIDKKPIILDKARTIWTAYPRLSDTASDAALCRYLLRCTTDRTTEVQHTRRHLGRSIFSHQDCRLVSIWDLFTDICLQTTKATEPHQIHAELAYILVVATLFLMLESMTDNELPHDAALTRINRCIRTQDT